MNTNYEKIVQSKTNEELAEIHQKRSDYSPEFLEEYDKEVIRRGLSFDTLDDLAEKYDKQPKIEKFLNFYLRWLMPIGIVLAILTGRWDIETQIKQGEIIGALFSAFTLLFYIIITIYAIVRFLKKKPDAVFFVKYHAVLIFLYQVSVMINLWSLVGQTDSHELIDSSIGPVVKAVWAVFVFFSMNSKIVKELIPVESRCLDTKGKTLFILSIVIPLFLVALSWIIKLIGV